MSDYRNTEFVIYSTDTEKFQSVIIGLLEKVYSSEKKCIFFSPMEDRLKVIDKALWTFSTNAFIPHGDKKLGFCDKQPIYFTSVCENPNAATVLMMVDSFDYSSWNDNFEKIILVMNSSDKNNSQLDVINELQSDLQKKLKNVRYWEQASSGWTKIV
ncbi:hypothetical protein FACS189472_14320 [Alphaproteobacteria bacterium]|nr:hypothetical protein FACS189472_14320 [Alphaproteobacteria bacterium]